MIKNAAEKRIETVMSVWKVLDKNLEATGIEFFQRIFTYAPEALQLFSFRDEADLYHSEALSKHAASVMGTIGTALTMLNDLEHLVTILK